MNRKTWLQENTNTVTNGLKNEMRTIITSGFQYDSHATITNISIRFLFGNAGIKSVKWVFYNEVNMKSWANLL